MVAVNNVLDVLTFSLSTEQHGLSVPLRGVKESGLIGVIADASENASTKPRTLNFSLPHHFTHLSSRGEVRFGVLEWGTERLRLSPYQNSSGT